MAVNEAAAVQDGPTSEPEEPGGAGFLLEPAGTRRIFTAEQFTDEHHLFQKTADDFLEKEVLPVNDAIEKMEDGVMPGLIRKAAELGLAAVDIPEAYGGLGLDKRTSMIVSRALTRQASFAVAFGAHVGIGTLPIVIFGTPEQRERYLPALATAEKIAAYCLSEPGSGSDALGAKTTAVEDGDHYVLNGTKQWITNAGFADVFVIFAQLEGKFTAFIVDADTPGVSTGTEEHKLGIKGSSTRQVILQDARIPKNNLLGEAGRGHVIAFNILNIGRFKLGVGMGGGAMHALHHALEYATQRKQFKTRLVDFPAIREKLAKIACFIYANDSMSWRLGGQLDDQIEALDKSDPEHWKQAVEVISDYAIEASILKVYGSEGLGFCLDEALQIHGGYGFTSEYPIEQPYRDARVNRIFEGTNEINRMLIPGTLFKRVLKGKINFMPLMGAVEAEVKSGAVAEPPEPGEDGAYAPLEIERFMNEQAKKVLVYTAGAAIQKHMADLDRQQEVLMALADMAIAVYAADSTLCRVIQKLDDDGAESTGAHQAIARVVVTEAYRNVAIIARDLAGYLAKNPARMIDGIRRLGPYVPVDLITARREIAQALVDAGRYRF